MKILALDVSGAATGWAYGVNGKLEGFGKFISKTSGSKGKRLSEFSDWLTALFTAKVPDIILVEKPFRGRNSNVLANLSKFIAMVEVAAFKTLQLELEDNWFLDPKSIKKIMAVKKGKDHDANKRIMVRRINDLYGLHLKYVPKKGKNHNDDDTADAIAVLHAWWKVSNIK